MYFLELAKKHPEYSFVVKPHPALRYKCISEKFLTEQEYDDYIAQWNSLENATVYTDGNYFDIFKTSDVLITDSSSFLAEYFYSGKPTTLCEIMGKADMWLFRSYWDFEFPNLTYLILNLLEDCTASLQSPCLR